MPKKYKLGILPGDGIGKEVVPAAVRVVQAACEGVGGFDIELRGFDCGGEYYLANGEEWSEEAEEYVWNEADAVLLGAIGALDSKGESVKLPDGNLAGYNVVIGLRLRLDLYANVRPVKLYEGVPTPLADKGPDDIDMVIIRENTEGLYTPARGALSRGGLKDLAVDMRVITKKGSERVSRFAFQVAEERNGAPSDGVKRVTCVDKSNLLAGCQLFRESFNRIGEEYPKIEKDYAFVDAWTQWCLKKPEFYDVVVTPNEFGDIITDLGGAVQGGLGVAPAGNIGQKYGVFEPVHGSAPKHAGKGAANPIAATLAGSMLLEWLGKKHNDNKVLKAGGLVKEAVASVLRDGEPRTYDLCLGQWLGITPSSTDKVGDAIAERARSLASEG
ncbi:MAG: isocitrate/isopropylmalate dehydrogenase family protein [Candidatus Thorarchaeota archaeon]|nr:MAG: isocitrate/isopropylmalate dehydrogenase family protein [Candidatus Thorarchaeota archaeon]